MALFEAADALNTSNRSDRNSVEFGDSNLLDDGEMGDLDGDSFPAGLIHTPVDSRSSRHPTPAKL